MAKLVTDPAILAQLNAQSEVTDPAVLAQLNGQMGVGDYAADIAKGAGTGLVRGAAMVAGQGGDLSNLAGAGLKTLEERGVNVAGARQSMLGAMPAWLRKYHEQPPGDYGSGKMMEVAERAAGAPIASYEPKSFFGRAARTTGEFVPAALLTRSGLAAGAVGPGVVSETAGELTKGTKAEPYARVGGAIAGTFAPNLLRRAVTPLPSNPGRQQAVQTLEDEGVTSLTAGQRTGNKPLQYLEDARGGQTAQNMLEQQGEQFTSAALRRVGENANRATPEVIDQAVRRIGGQFDALAARNTAVADRQFNNDLVGAVQGYFNLVAQPNRAPVVGNFANEIINQIQRNSGTLPGDVYQNLRSRMERAARAASGQHEVAGTLRGMREALDDVMERSLQASGNTADLAAWQEARNQYRNLLVIERASSGAGEQAASGILSPRQLRGHVTNVQGTRNYARGRGDFADLVRSGNEVMTPLPNSGTAQRYNAMNLGLGIPAAIAGGYGGYQGQGAEGAALGAFAGAIAPRVAGRIMMSGPGQAYLGNQVLPAAQGQMSPRALASAILAAQQGEQRRQIAP